MKKCAICGKEFKPRNIRNIYCSSECNAKANSIKKREAAKRRKTQKPKETPKKPQKGKLSRDAADARERRMTYGIYMAYKKRGWLNAC